MSSDIFTVNLANVSCQPRGVGTSTVLKHQEVWGLVRRSQCRVEPGLEPQESGGRIPARLQRPGPGQVSPSPALCFIAGIDYKTTTILLDGRRVKLELW